MKNPLLIWTIVIVVFISSIADAGKWITTENGERFYVETEQTLTWFEAIDKCTQMNMTLISMDSETKTQEINKVMKTNSNVLYGGERWSWTGGHDHNVSRHFEWISTGEAFGYTNWYSNEPDNANHHCVLMHVGTSLLWTDYNCYSKVGFVCEENPLQKVTTEEMVLLKEPMQNEINLLKEKIEELDTLKKEFEKFKRESLEEMKQKQEEFLTLQQSSEQTQTELSALKGQIPNENEIKQMLRYIQTTQVQNQNQIIDKFTKSCDFKNSEVIKASGNQDISNPIFCATQTALLKVMSEELEDLKKENKELFVALQKSYETNTDRTIPIL